MTGDPSDLDLQTLWQSQPKEHDPMTVAEIHERARAFDIKVRRRNAREYLACALVIVGFSPLLFHGAGWMIPASSALVMAGTVYVAWQLHRRTGAQRAPSGDAPLLVHHREALVRQRDALRAVGRWYLAPFLPGLGLLLAGRWFQAPAANRSAQTDHLIILLAGGIIALAFAVVWLINQRAADRLDREIERLP